MSARTPSDVIADILADMNEHVVKMHLLLADLAGMTRGDSRDPASEMEPVVLDLLGIASDLRCAISDVEGRIRSEESDDDEEDEEEDEDDVDNDDEEAAAAEE